MFELLLPEPKKVSIWLKDAPMKFQKMKWLMLFFKAHELIKKQVAWQEEIQNASWRCKRTNC